jgi:hypothetical protein
MDTSSIARLSTDLATTRTEAAVATTVLRKALDIEAQGALALLDALPPRPATNPPHLGQHVDTFA